MILGVIPARGGSKGIPRKNLRLIWGKPLIYWSIKAAKESVLIDDFVVSTEDNEIAKGCNAKVHCRPRFLAEDDSTTLELLQYILEQGQREITLLVLLQPTSPLRDGKLIDKCIKTMLLDSALDSLATGHYQTNGEWTEKNSPRQKKEGKFWEDGNIYIFKPEVIKSGRWKGDYARNMVIPKYQNYEIDDAVDWFIVERLGRKYNESFVGISQ